MFHNWGLDFSTFNKLNCLSLETVFNKIPKTHKIFAFKLCQDALPVRVCVCVCVGVCVCVCVCVCVLPATSCALCPNDEVVVFQPRTGTALDLGSVGNFLQLSIFGNSL